MPVAYLISSHHSRSKPSVAYMLQRATREDRETRRLGRSSSFALGSCSEQGRKHEGRGDLGWVVLDRYGQLDTFVKRHRSGRRCVRGRKGEGGGGSMRGKAVPIAVSFAVLAPRRSHTCLYNIYPRAGNSHLLVVVAMRRSRNY